MKIFMYQFIYDLDTFPFAGLWGGGGDEHIYVLIYL